ncbi:methyl-accepting chemotaxis protein [Kineococcus xinjiangensis]|uniref:Methyl-accepting chemotaxis protein n=1 Tax=Kineococcus xinjiangensis TaxID=512762 RepID=A0A2S6IFG5_9ACTN|nr:methyl-accepting chemotaxis protein [Kineococcus xinjiangensis]PPK92890.1 methyl-accepting chemotaxis protein [Kineococcus xinjiangensis]
MSTPTAPARSGNRIAAAFTDLPVRKKLTVLVAASLLALSTCLGVTTYNGRIADATATQLKDLNLAGATVLQLDRVASELKVNGLQAIVREDPSVQGALLQDKITDAEALLAELKAVPLPEAESAAVDRLTGVYAEYTTTIKAYVAGAAQDPGAARLAWEQIDVDNYLVSAVLANERALFADTIARAETAANESRTRAEQVMWVAVGIAAVLLCVLAHVVVTSITRPLRLVRKSLLAMADGDLTVPAPVTSRDEVGVMARALEEAQTGVRSVVASVSASAHSVAAAAEELASTSDTMATSANLAASQAQGVSDAAGLVSGNVSTVAKGAEEMGISIGEIAHNANEAARVAASAVSVAQATTAQVGKLGDSSREIATVVGVITSIAEQTNLLALNATIEAARAGDYGKGFAVVASEVKELAQETARATEDISARVHAIQTDTQGAVTAISEISSIIAQINEYQTTIASAVEEQTATTGEMNRSVSAAAEGAGGIAANIAGLASASQVTTDGVLQSQRAATELSAMAHELQSLVSRFRY